MLGVIGATNLKPNINVRQRTAGEFAGKLKGIIEGMKTRDLSQRVMSDELNGLGIKAAKGEGMGSDSIAKSYE